MSDFISRSALLAEYDRQHEGEPGKARKLIADAPAVDAVEVVHGQPVPHYQTWFTSDGEPVKTYQIGYECPFCGSIDIAYFCPHCGAKMDGGDADV